MPPAFRPARIHLGRQLAQEQGLPTLREEEVNRKKRLRASITPGPRTRVRVLSQSSSGFGSIHLWSTSEYLRNLNCSLRPSTEPPAANTNRGLIQYFITPQKTSTLQPYTRLTMILSQERAEGFCFQTLQEGSATTV